MATRSRRHHVQRELAFRTWGGKREGAGRKPKGPKAGMSHRPRPALASRFPLHVTVRVLPHVWNLRSRRSFAIVGPAIYKAADRFAMRVCAFSIQGNHIHLIVEAADQTALARGMKGFGVRVARGLNTMMKKRRGPVLADRYHARILRTPTEVRKAVSYVIHNHRKHALDRGEALSPAFIDEYSSASLENRIGLPAPHTWLLAHCRASPAPGSSQNLRKQPQGLWAV